MLLLLLSIALFALVLVLPAVPSLWEVFRPKDDGRLHIAEQYVRDPRFFGASFRSKLSPFVDEAHAGGEQQADVQLRTEEGVRWAPDLLVPADERTHGIDIGDRVTVGHHAGIRDAWALHHLDVQNDVVARTLTSDNTMHLGPGVHILRWIDSDGDITVDADSDLGLSASGGARVTLGDRVRFERVWGFPVASKTASKTPFEHDEHKGKAVVDQTKSDASDHQSLILYGPVHVQHGTTLPAHLKVHGAVAIEPGVTIAGNVIARGDVTIASDARVGGHIFCEGDIRLGPGSRVGREGVAKTVYATGKVLIADDVEVFGWVVSENGGQTV